MAFFSLFFISIVCSASAKTIFYKFHANNDATVNDCILNAMDTFMEETCVTFEPGTENAVVFMQSGHCSWQASNNTVHMATDCTNEETCYLILSHVLSIETPAHHSHISRLVNLKYNCTGRCTLICENGGTVTNQCECECGYGFTGDRCESLQKQRIFNDESCGIVNTSQVALSAYPRATKGPVFCQWLIKGAPTEIIEFSIQDLDLDAEKVAQTETCNDMFYIWGSQQISSPVSCSAANVENLFGKTFKSDSNWLLMELRMNPWSETAHKGPLIKYRLISPASNKVSVLRAHSSEMSASSSTEIAVSTVLFLGIFCFLYHKD